MPLYQYQSITAKGKKKSGLIDASTEQEAKSKLRAQGEMVIKLLPKRSHDGKSFNKEQLYAFTLQLSQLFTAGVPLYESLIAIEEQYRGEKFQRVLLSICDQIKGGSTLSEAMGHFPETFDRMYCAMIRAGESVGALGLVLEKLKTLLAKQIKLKKQLTTAMIYPAILATFSLVVIAVLIGFVVPSIEGIFADRELNGFTNFVLGTSRFLRAWWWVYLPLFAGAIGFAIYKLRTEEGRLFLERFLLKVPVLNKLTIHTAVARFTRTMGTLQMGGLPMIDSLQIAREVMRNVTLEEEMKVAEERIVEGSSLSSQLRNSKWFPQIVARMVSVGEESGTLPVMLSSVADMYEDELEKTLDQAVALAQPVILIVMGTIIGAIMMAILLPLTDVSSFAVS